MTKRKKLTQQQVDGFREQGYCLVDGLFSRDEVEGVRREITRIMQTYPDVPEGLVQMEPAVKRGEVKPENPELGVRKLFQMAVQNAFFRSIAFHPGMVGIANTLFGPDITLFQSMLLMKPPHFGGQKVWHQDNAYFRLVPNDIVGFWVACDDTDVDNGCMHVLPGSHRNGVAEHGGVADDYGLLHPPCVEDAIACQLSAGSALVFHGEIYHFTPSNQTDRRRRAVQYHYAPTLCRSKADSPFPPKQGEIVVSGAGAEMP
ncbi:MAG: phytanoyl-CoA dioxygenase family protein [candidate division Zixibacteria bacterium]|nr:phytanoyl-CoA dioxygenase family protein [candidate division Zixibacteria bacterium]